MVIRECIISGVSITKLTARLLYHHKWCSPWIAGWFNDTNRPPSDDEVVFNMARG